MDLRERLVDFERLQWAYWFQHRVDDLTGETRARWRKEIDTPYARLSEKEKDKDREWADKLLALVKVALKAKSTSLERLALTTGDCMGKPAERKMQESEGLPTQVGCRRVSSVEALAHLVVCRQARIKIAYSCPPSQTLIEFLYYDSGLCGWCKKPQNGRKTHNLFGRKACTPCYDTISIQGGG